MNTRIAWFFTLQGRLSRSAFLGIGLALLGVKIAIDAWLCHALELAPWSPFVYLTPLPWTALRGDGGWRWALFALPSVLFCWIGVTMTWRRMVDAGLPFWVLLGFFLPYANLVLFAVLAALPPRGVPNPTAGATPAGRQLFAGAPAVIAAVVTVALGWFSFAFLRDYGGLLFFGLPMVQGLVVGMSTARLPFARAATQLFLSYLLGALILLAFAYEGLACIVMAVLPWVNMGLLGMVVGRAIAPTQRRAAVAGLAIVPLLQWLEPRLAPAATVYSVRTDVVVEASPEQVWQSLVAFEELPPPTELPFRLGIAYPMHATIRGRGVGAVRHCSFSTGDFVEPIEVWDEPRLLRFSVTECPPPMQEWNPFHSPEDVHAAHLHGYFQARQGQFELQPQPDGTTLLCGTTWYSHGLRPEPYWRLWSDWLVHTIHGRVLEHIRRTAERR